MNTPLERLEIARLVKLEIIGEPEANNDFGMSPRWVRILLNNETKLRRYLGRIDEKVNIYLFPSKSTELRFDEATPILNYTNAAKQFAKISDFTRYPLLENEPIGTMKDALEYFEYHVPENEGRDSINIMMFGFGSRLENTKNIIGPTAWMVLHRICHTFYNEKIRLQWKKLVSDIFYSKKVDEVTEVLVQESLFLFRSARTNNINNSDEGLIDLMAHTIVKKGDVELNPDGIVKYGLLMSDVESIDIFIKALYLYLKRELSQAKGKYLFV